MAKGLKVGDTVTVREELRLPRKDPAYQAGLHRLKPGELGTVVGPSDGRSVIVDFSGKKVTLSSQRLDQVKQPLSSAKTTEKSSARRGRPRSGAVSSSAPQTAPSQPTNQLVDYNSG